MSDLTWRDTPLIDLAFYINGVAFKPSDWSDDGLNIVRIEQINNPDGPCDKYAGPVFDENKINDGDLVFSWSATLKVVIWSGGEAVLNQHLFKVVPKKGYDLNFIYFLLDWCMESLGNSSQGSTMKHIKRGALEKFFVKTPKIDYQRKIADILLKIESAIKKTEALIEKYQQIKAGLMHDLFTRGVLPDGKLRPTREQAPELYRETGIGWIPKEWVVGEFHKYINIVDPNPSHRYPEEVSDGVPICSTENFLGEEDFDLSKAKHVSKTSFFEQDLRCQFKASDVVFARKGRIGLARRYGVTDKVFSHTVVLFKPDVVHVNENWLLWIARSDWFLGGIDRTMNSNSGVPTLGVDFIGRVIIPFPEKSEQSRVANYLDSASKAIRKAQAELENLKARKNGLMHDLLTGKVAVKVDATEEEHA